MCDVFNPPSHHAVLRQHGCEPEAVRVNRQAVIDRAALPPILAVRGLDDIANDHGTLRAAYAEELPGPTVQSGYRCALPNSHHIETMSQEAQEVFHPDCRVSALSRHACR